MTIEATLERIAVALEAIAGKPTAVQSDPKPETTRKPRTTAAKSDPAPDPASEPEVDPFAAVDEPAKKPTRDDVRTALVACQGRIGPTAAQAILKKHGGVDTLPALKDDSKFAAIIAAANAA